MQSLLAKTLPSAMVTYR